MREYDRTTLTFNNDITFKLDTYTAHIKILVRLIQPVLESPKLMKYIYIV